MGDSNGNAATPTAEPNRGPTAAIVGGMLIGIVAVGNLAWDAGRIAYDHRDVIIQILKGEGVARSASSKSDLFKNDMYIAFDTGNGEVTTFRVALHGKEEFTGETTSLTSQSKGIVTGSMRAGTISLTYASKDPNRPGFGNLILRPHISAAESDSPVYTGMAVFHDCKCRDGSVKQNGSIQITQAIMTSSPELPTHLKARYFGKGPQKVPVLFPEDVQKFASSSSSAEPCLASNQGTVT